MLESCRLAITQTHAHTRREGREAEVLARPFVYVTLLRFSEREGGRAGSYDRCEYGEEAD